jgi:hypothetical protein
MCWLFPREASAWNWVGERNFHFFSGAFSYQFEEETMNLHMPFSLSVRTKLRLFQRVIFHYISYLEIVQNFAGTSHKEQCRLILITFRH